MGRPLRIEYAGAQYHVTARGNEQKDVFKNQRDREQFLSYLESAVVRYGAVIHAYCLMNNHYHLLLETPSANLSQIMQHINGAYTNYFNIKRKRSGHLFQGRYKAILIEADEYAKELSRYIHLNPVKAGMAARPEEYRWSSYMDYIGNRQNHDWLRTSSILEYFGDANDAGDKYKSFVEEMLACDYESPLKGVIAATILGGEEFVAEISAKHVAGKQFERDVPAVKKLSARPTIDVVIEAVRKEFGDNRLSARASLYLCHKYSGARLREIGERFGKGESAVSQASRRFQQELQKDIELKKRIDAIGEALGLSRV